PGPLGATGATGGAGEAPHEIVPGDQSLGEVSGTPEVTRVIRTAELSVVIPRDAFDERFGQAVDVAEEQGGFVADSRTRTRSGSLTVRVPAANFDETLRALRALGTVEVESVHGKDVTADYVDLHANLRIAGGGCGGPVGAECGRSLHRADDPRAERARRDPAAHRAAPGAAPAARRSHLARDDRPPPSRAGHRTRVRGGEGEHPERVRTRGSRVRRRDRGDRDRARLPSAAGGARGPRRGAG